MQEPGAAGGRSELRASAAATSALRERSHRQPALQRGRHDAAQSWNPLSMTNIDWQPRSAVAGLRRNASRRRGAVVGGPTVERGPGAEGAGRRPPAATAQPAGLTDAASIHHQEIWICQIRAVEYSALIIWYAGRSPPSRDRDGLGGLVLGAAPTLCRRCDQGSKPEGPNVHARIRRSGFACHERRHPRGQRVRPSPPPILRSRDLWRADGCVADADVASDTAGAFG